MATFFTGERTGGAIIWLIQCMRVPDTWWSEQPCFYCEKTSGPDVLQHKSTYALVCPRCRRLNEIKEFAEGLCAWVGIPLVMLSTKLWAYIANWLTDNFKHVVGGNACFVLSFALLPIMVAAAIWITVLFCRLVRPRRPESPSWIWSYESPFTLDESGKIYMVEPPFRDRPARLHVGSDEIEQFISSASKVNTGSVK